MSKMFFDLIISLIKLFIVSMKEPLFEPSLVTATQYISPKITHFSQQLLIIRIIV